jgi:hypothetical protein
MKMVERVSGLRVFGRSKSGKPILEMEQRDGFLWCRDEDGWQPAVQDTGDGTYTIGWTEDGHGGVALTSMNDPNFDEDGNCANPLMEQFLKTRVRPN